MKSFGGFCFFIILFSLNFRIYGQVKENVEVLPKILAESVGEDCKQVKTGTVVLFLQPDYPPAAQAAQVGGTVIVDIKLNEQGFVSEIENVSGDKPFQDVAAAAARKIKFTPTTCDGVPVSVRAEMIYNFIPYPVNEGYFKTAQIKNFPDVKSDSQFYEAILDLTENYRIAFGYADKKFHADAPLTRGDFAHFLRLTLDLLSERARIGGKFPRRIGLFYPLNPQNLKITDKIKGLGNKEPFSESVRILLSKYDISLLDKKKEFSGKMPLTQTKILDLWTKIFGADAVPVNFERENGGERIITRGEFALFLQESLNVLTYKVLP